MHVHTMITGAVVVMTATVGAGCGKPSATAADSNKPPKSTLTLFVEGATGKTAVDAGRRAQETIEQVSSRHNADLDAVLGAEP